MFFPTSPEYGIGKILAVLTVVFGNFGPTATGHSCGPVLICRMTTPIPLHWLSTDTATISRRGSVIANLAVAFDGCGAYYQHRHVDFQQRPIRREWRAGPHSPWIGSKLRMGNPRRIPRMGTLSGFGTPLFFAVPFHECNIIHHAPGGRDPASLLKCYGVVDRSIKMGPVWERATRSVRSASNRRSSLVRDIALWSTPRCSRHRRRREIRRRLITVFATCWLNFAMQRFCLSRESPIRPETPKPRTRSRSNAGFRSAGKLPCRSPRHRISRWAHDGS